MGVAAGADGIGQQHAVEPGVDDTVTRAQGDAAAGHDEVGQGVLGIDIHRLGVGRGVAERLHGQVGGKAQAGQVFQLVPGHRAGGILGADGGHQWLAVGARADALGAAGPAHHFLGQGEALAGIGWHRGCAEQVAGRQAHGLARPGGEAAPDDQVDAAAGAHFIEQHLGLEFELTQHFAGLGQDLAVVGADLDHIAHTDLVDGRLEYQCAGILHGVVENGSHLAADTDSAALFIRHARNVVAEEPQYGVSGGLAGGAGADHVADKGHRQAPGLQVGDLLHGAGDTVFRGLEPVAGHLVHGQGVQGDIRARPGIGGGGQIVSVGFTGHLEHGELDRLGHCRPTGEPLAIGPGLHHRTGVGIALVGQLGHIMEGLEY